MNVGGHIFDGNKNGQPTESQIQRLLETQSKNFLFYTSPLSRNFIAATHNGTEQFVWPPHICMHD